MGIHVTCENGHDLNIKDSYAGKKGRCPHCKAIVQVPKKDAVSDDDVLEMLMAGGLPKQARESFHDDDDSGSIHDEPHRTKKSDSLSLVGLSAVRHNKTCEDCGQSDPHWHASCSRCGRSYPGHELG